MKNNLRKMHWKKLLPVVIAGIAVLVGVCLLLYRLLESGSISPVAMIILAALISVALPILRSNYFPSGKDCAAEYDFHEKRLGENMRRRIADRLGQETLNHIFGPDGRFRDSVDEHLQLLLENEAVGRDAELRFDLLLIRSHFYEQSGDPQASIQQLTLALRIYPHHFIANFRLAMNYEWIGSVGNAVSHYQKAMQDPGGISRGMRKLTVANINRLQTGV
jgi:hypothetical protein